MPVGRGEDPRGKLKAAARAWATGRSGGGTADDQATSSAADAIAAIEARRAGARSRSELEIGPDEAEAVTLFIGLSSQWRIHAMAGVRTGLEYTAIAPTATMMGIMMTPALFDDIRTMEGAALAAFAGA